MPVNCTKGNLKTATTWYADNGYGAPTNLEDGDLSTYTQGYTYCCGDYVTAFNLCTFSFAIYSAAAYGNLEGEKLQGSNDTTNGSDGTWTDILTFTDGINTSAPAAYPGWCMTDFNVNATIAYRYYRITGDGSTNQIQSEWELWDSADLNIRSIIDMPYGDLTTSIRAITDQPYSILFSLSNFVEQYYSIKLGTFLSMYYSDSPLLKHIVNQYYSDSPNITKNITMKYSDMLILRQYRDMPYNIQSDLIKKLEMKYSLAGEPLMKLLEHRYNILVNAVLLKKTDMPYMLQEGNTLSTISSSVTIGGRAVSPIHVSIEYSITNSVASGEAHLKLESEYLQVEQGEDFLLTIGGTTHNLIVDSAPRRVRAGVADTTYIIEGKSPAILLSTPWCKTFTCVFDHDTAKNIFEALADPIQVDWRIVDFPVLADTLYANDEDKMSVMRKLTQSCGAVIHSDPDGSLKVVYRYPVPLNQLATEGPDYYLTDSRNFISQNESFKHNTGHNRYYVSSVNQPDERTWLEQDDYPNVLAFEVPWQDTKMSLDHSGGPAVNPPIYVGVIDVLYPNESEPAERVEFIAGFSNTSRPIYQMVQVEWLRTQLGSITYSEDGQLEAEVKDGPTEGYSLADVRYMTRYKLWIVDNGTATDVQYILKVENDDEDSSIAGCQ